MCLYRGGFDRSVQRALVSFLTPAAEETWGRRGVSRGGQGVRYRRRVPVLRPPRLDDCALRHRRAHAADTRRAPGQDDAAGAPIVGGHRGVWRLGRGDRQPDREGEQEKEALAPGRARHGVDAAHVVHGHGLVRAVLGPVVVLGRDWRSWRGHWLEDVGPHVDGHGVLHGVLHGNTDRGLLRRQGQQEHAEGPSAAPQHLRHCHGADLGGVLHRGH
mmetsp:Transcript_42359/g.96325  ORF Transcript_42359/g.96325 Transcript_42359/m.96325 type:complete len:216 (+) Transcript_42359:649-1296(+)